ncbi:MAG: NADH:flavin oxidoreductase/NADH oxidase, partial [Candidatus Puniceispirillum sp.]
MSSMLFSPITLAGLDLPNRIAVAPMCQYSAEEGTMNDWHLVNLGQFAMSGPGLVIIEATGVEPAGRITPGCVGLYSDANEAAMKRVVDFCKSVGDSKIAVQLAHAGRKASAERPWEGGNALKDGAWQTYGPSAIAFADGWHVPEALDDAGLVRIKDAFVTAAKRAVRLGIDAIELHAAHGYLLHQFLSPISNQRADQYGGSLDNRMRFPLELFDVVKAAVPADMPVLVRVSASDWVEGGWHVDGTIAFAKALEAAGCAAIHVSSGGNSLAQKLEIGYGY